MAFLYTFGIAVFAGIGTFLFVGLIIPLVILGLILIIKQGFDTGIATTSDKPHEDMYNG